jgi:ABC-2 type transport system permease protein
MKQTLSITRKEIQDYFGSPMALIFIGAFLAITLFSFFWIDTFFARGIADVRPLFSWMPLLLIVLIAALTMRQWSEEQRSGTLEVLLTLPVSYAQLVLGKLLAVLALVAISLALTLFLPVTVSLMGNLDWGPVAGGYLAAMLLAAAYASIGLFVSSRTDNQIVSLISTVLVCGLFYLAGSSGVTDFAGNVGGEFLRAIGAGSRFESIQRGVVDLRDLIYYLSLSGVFLTLNVFSLAAKSWGKGERTRPQRVGTTVTSVILVLNLAMVNVWMFPLNRLRVDLTQRREYSLSQTTLDLLGNLQEPLLLRGYFSEKTHPLLAPLVPTIRDLIKEYDVASGGRVQVEFIDPAENPEAEAEANQVYGIRSTPFQVAGRYESSVINSYFNILVRYGDQSETLGFTDLIEVQPRREGIDVSLRNLEYDLTRSIKKVVYGFQSVDAVLRALPDPAELQVYVTMDTLPEWLADVPSTVETVAGEIAVESDGKFTYTVIDPDAADSPVTREQLFEQFEIQPYAVSFFSNESYYLHLVLSSGDQSQVVYPQGEMTEADIRTSIESALKRFSTGFLKVVGLWTPPAEPTQDPMTGQMQQPLSTWEQAADFLRQEYEVRSVDLSTGSVAQDVDVLAVIAPQNLQEKELFAIDQYLMRGGSVVFAAGNYTLIPDQFTGSLAVNGVQDGAQDLLTTYGITVENSLVLDAQNEPFPIPVTREVGGMQIQEIRAVDYPFFVDVRSDGMATESPIMANLPAVTLNWVSPVTVDEQGNTERTVTKLLQSSAASWTQNDTNIQPDFELYPDFGFAPGGEPASYTLAASVQGVFDSYFKDKAAPSLGAVDEPEVGDVGVAADPALQQSTPGVIETSPDTARLVVFGSAEFLDDIVFEISSSLSMDRYLNSLRLLQNAVAWSTEDLDLLSIRSRGSVSRPLMPLTERQQSFWEGANYVVALVALGAIGIVWNTHTKNEQPMDLIRPDKTKPGATQESDCEAGEVKQ